MLTVKTKKEFASLADDLARGMQLVNYQNVLYVPVDYDTLELGRVPSPDRRVWLPLSVHQVMYLANTVQHVLFSNDSEARNYVLMVQQIAERRHAATDAVLVQSPDGLRELRGDGNLHVPSQDFCAHFITTPLNEDQTVKDELFGVLQEWLVTEEDVVSLLRHLATVLAPSWSAVRYVLLVGEGRNGKSLLMKMLVDLFGQHNVSNVTRQDMSNKSPVCHELTNRLLNVVFDGEATYVKDSGMEKSLTAGDPTPVRKLYESHPTIVQTNGLFIEGVNREPKSSDKSMALQKRLVRFYLPNVYELNHEFERRMRSPEMLGALLSLLIDHYVQEHEVAEKLALTRSAIEMKLEHMRVNSLASQFLEYIDREDPLGANGLIGEDLDDLSVRFQRWRLLCNDLNTWAVPDVSQLLKPMFITSRRSKRVNGRIVKVRSIEAFTSDITEFLGYIRGEEEDLHEATDDTVVDERAVLGLESAAATGD